MQLRPPVALVLVLVLAGSLGSIAVGQDSPRKPAVLVGKDVVDPLTGAVVASALATHAAAEPIPGNPGEFLLREKGKRTLYVDTGRIQQGKVVAVPLPPPPVVPVQTYVAWRGGQLEAWHAMTKKQLWTAAARPWREVVWCAFDLALTAERTAANTCELVARRVKTGVVAFRLAAGFVASVAAWGSPKGGLLIVRGGADGFCKVIDLTGKERFSIPHALQVLPAPGHLVISTAKGLRSVSRVGRVLWNQVLRPKQTFRLGASGVNVQRIPGGDLLVAGYNPYSDSGVRVQRISEGSGAIRWTTTCAPLGARHSRYRQRAYVAPFPNRNIAAVVSRGSRAFVETLDLKTGASRGRWLY